MRVASMQMAGAGSSVGKGGPARSSEFLLAVVGLAWYLRVLDPIAFRWGLQALDPNLSLTHIHAGAKAAKLVAPACSP